MSSHKRVLANFKRIGISSPPRKLPKTVRGVPSVLARPVDAFELMLNLMNLSFMQMGRIISAQVKMKVIQTST